MFNNLYEKAKKFIKEYLWFFISLIVIILLFQIELPYKIEAPGGYISLKDRISIDGKEDTTEGDLGLAYVTVVKSNVPFLAYSLLNPNWDILTKDEYINENETLEDLEVRDKLYYNEAMSNAIYVAYNYANYNISINKVKIFVSYINTDDSNLKVGDQILKIDNQEISETDDINNAIKDKEEVKILVLRNDKEIEVTSKIHIINGESKIGIYVIKNYDLSEDPKVSINTKDNESGPSGGLMTSLGIYSKLTNTDLTKNDKIIGTGKISMDGTVGAIGGVKYKLIGAVKNKVKVFLCPKANYEEAINIKNEHNYDIIIKAVDNFSEAVEYLKGR